MSAHPFKLINPPEGQTKIIEAAIAAIDYPWERLTDAVQADSDKAVLVEWDDTGQGTSGLFYGGSLRIVLSTRSYHLDSGAGFVFAHEVGHLVDSATLRDEDREALMRVTHADPKTYRWPAGHGWSHDQPHTEEWATSNDYLFRHNEAFADLFVEAFAPKVWDGSFYPGAPSKGPDWLRFVHTTDDLDVVRRITLARELPKPKETTMEGNSKLWVLIRRLRDRLNNQRRRIRRLERQVEKLRRRQ